MWLLQVLKQSNWCSFDNVDSVHQGYVWHTYSLDVGGILCTSNHVSVTYASVLMWLLQVLKQSNWCSFDNVDSVHQGYVWHTYSLDVGGILCTSNHVSVTYVHHSVLTFTLYTPMQGLFCIRNFLLTWKRVCQSVQRWILLFANTSSCRSPCSEYMQNYALNCLNKLMIFTELYTVLQATFGILTNSLLVQGIFSLVLHPSMVSAYSGKESLVGCFIQVWFPHTQGCTECNGVNTPPNCQEAFTDGSGVDNADIVIYVSADPAPPCGPASSDLGFAGSCQLEDVLDRYVYTCSESTKYYNRFRTQNWYLLWQAIITQ